MDVYAELARVAPDAGRAHDLPDRRRVHRRAREFLEQVPNPRIEKPIDFQNLRALMKNCCADDETADCADRGGRSVLDAGSARLGLCVKCAPWRTMGGVDASGSRYVAAAASVAREVLAVHAADVDATGRFPQREHRRARAQRADRAVRARAARRRRAGDARLRRGRRGAGARLRVERDDLHHARERVAGDRGVDDARQPRRDPARHRRRQAPDHAGVLRGRIAVAVLVADVGAGGAPGRSRLRRERAQVVGDVGAPRRLVRRQRAAAGRGGAVGVGAVLDAPARRRGAHQGGVQRARSARQRLGAGRHRGLSPGRSRSAVRDGRRHDHDPRRGAALVLRRHGGAGQRPRVWPPSS